MPFPDRNAFLAQAADGNDSTFIPLWKRWPADLETRSPPG
jgi:anthranilate synthase component 1